MSGNPILDRQIAESVQALPQRQITQTPEQMGVPMPQQMQQMPQQMPRQVQQMPQQMLQMSQQPFRLPTQMPQMPTQDFSYRPQVSNPFFGGAIPMNFNLPSVNQIPADFAVRKYSPSMTDPAPIVKPRFNNQISQGESNYLTGDSWNGGSQN
jgi:hypothetical protein